MTDVNDAAVIGNSEAHRGSFVPGMIEVESVVMHDLDGRVDLFHFHCDRHPFPGGGEIVTDVNGVLSCQNAANADGLLSDRAR